MRLLWIVAAVVILSAPAARAELWKYEDETGAANFTDSYANVPPAFRHTARKHVIQETAPAPADGGIEAIKRERARVIDSFTEEQAKEALVKGLLTVDEANHLVQKGVLRSSEIGDQYRFAGKPPPAPAAGPNPADPNAAPAGPNDQAVRELNELTMLRDAQAGQLGQVRSIMDNLTAIKDSPKFTYALIGELVLAVLLIVAMPFVMRNYNDDGTRRIIRASFFFSFIIISATGNMLLFKDEVAAILNLKNTATVNIHSAPVDADPGAQPASLQGKPWQPEQAAPAKP